MAEECIFCKIVEGQVPTIKVYEDEKHMAFLDINPRNPGHTLLIPKKHYETILEMTEDELADLARVLRKVVKGVKYATNAEGISIAQSNGRSAGQRVPHVHFFIIPRFLTETPPGLEEIIPVKRMDQTAMEAIAEKIKENMGGDVEIPEEFSIEKEETEKKKETSKEEEEEINFEF